MGAWPCSWLQAVVFGWDQLVDLRVQCFLRELQGVKDTSPGLQFLPSNPFSIIAVTLIVLRPVYLLPVYIKKKKKRKLCLKFNSLHYGLDTEQIKVSFTKSCLLPHSWEVFSLGAKGSPLCSPLGSGGSPSLLPKGQSWRADNTSKLRGTCLGVLAPRKAVLWDTLELGCCTAKAWHAGHESTPEDMVGGLSRAGIPQPLLGMLC